jgi:hypothetical protein
LTFLRSAPCSGKVAEGVPCGAAGNGHKALRSRPGGGQRLVWEKSAQVYSRPARTLAPAQGTCRSRCVGDGDLDRGDRRQGAWRGSLETLRKHGPRAETHRKTVSSQRGLVRYLHRCALTETTLSLIRWQRCPQSRSDHSVRLVSRGCGGRRRLPGARSGPATDAADARGNRR